MTKSLQVKDMKTIIGPVRCLALKGSWNADAAEVYRSKNCNALQWYASEEDESCEPLLAVAANLTFLQLRAARRMADASLAGLLNLRFLDAQNRGSDPLHFDRVTDLEVLGIDDRREVGGLTAPTLSSITLSFTKRPLSFFSPTRSLETLKLQMVGKHPIGLAADLPKLRSLLVLKGTIESFAELHAPHLEDITIDGAHTSGPVDLRPLVALPALRHVTIGVRNRTEFLGLDELRHRPEVRTSIGEVGSR